MWTATRLPIAIEMSLQTDPSSPCQWYGILIPWYTYHGTRVPLVPLQSGYWISPASLGTSELHSFLGFMEIQMSLQTDPSSRNSGMAYHGTRVRTYVLTYVRTLVHVYVPTGMAYHGTRVLE